VSRGPFLDVKEALDGYWMIRVDSQDEAIDWMKRCPMHGKGVVEIRQVFQMEEFPADVRAAAGDTPARLREAPQRGVIPAADFLSAPGEPAHSPSSRPSLDR
jgi:hypothetical protein